MYTNLKNIDCCLETESDDTAEIENDFKRENTIENGDPGR